VAKDSQTTTSMLEVRNRCRDLLFSLCSKADAAFAPAFVFVYVTSVMSEASIFRIEETAHLKAGASRDVTPDMVNDAAASSKAVVAIAVGDIEGCDKGWLVGYPLGVPDGCIVGCIEGPGDGS